MLWLGVTHSRVSIFSCTSITLSSSRYDHFADKGIIIGAPIKGYDGPIMTYCATDDMVCTGNFVIGVTHLAYSAGYSVQQGAKAMMDIAAGKRVVSNRVVWMPKTSEGDQPGQ